MFKAMLVVLCGLFATCTFAFGEIFTWTNPFYFVRSGETCGGEVDFTRTIPANMTGKVFVEMSEHGTNNWITVKSFPSWIPGTQMHWNTEDAIGAGIWDIRVYHEVYEGVNGQPGSNLRPFCPSNILTYQPIVVDNCPVEKINAPTVGQ